MVVVADSVSALSVVTVSAVWVSPVEAAVAVGVGASNVVTVIPPAIVVTSLASATLVKVVVVAASVVT